MTPTTALAQISGSFGYFGSHLRRLRLRGNKAPMQNGDSSSPDDVGGDDKQADSAASPSSPSEPTPTLPTGGVRPADADTANKKFLEEAPTESFSPEAATQPLPDVEPVKAKAKRPRPPKVGPPTTFVRVLPDEFKAELLAGANGKLLAKMVELGFDIHIRENSLIGYWGGTVLAQFGRHPKGDLVVMVPRKLAEKVELPKRFGLKGSQCCYKVNDEFLEIFDDQWHHLKTASERADVKDGPLEHKFMTANPGAAGVLPLDRQVQLPNHRAKLDCVAIEGEGEQRMLFVELKSGVSSDIPKAHISLEAFYREATDASGGLKDKLAEEYKNMLAQRTELGVLSKVTPDQVVPGMKLACVVALAHFRSESAAKDRLIDNAAKTDFPLYICQFAGSDARVPKQIRWQQLGKPGRNKPKTEVFGA